VSGVGGAGGYDGSGKGRARRGDENRECKADEDCELLPLVPPGSVYVLRDVSGVAPGGNSNTVSGPSSLGSLASEVARQPTNSTQSWGGLVGPVARTLEGLVSKCLSGGLGGRARARAPREEYRMDAVDDLQHMTNIVISERMFLDHFPSVLVRRVAWLRSAARLPPLAPGHYTSKSPRVSFRG
jgi:hypothetical protein